MYLCARKQRHHAHIITINKLMMNFTKLILTNKLFFHLLKNKLFLNMKCGERLILITVEDKSKLMVTYKWVLTRLYVYSHQKVVPFQSIVSAFAIGWLQYFRCHFVRTEKRLAVVADAQFLLFSIRFIFIPLIFKQRKKNTFVTSTISKSQ